MNLTCLLNWIWLSGAFLPSLFVGRDLKWSGLQAAVARSLFSGPREVYCRILVTETGSLYCVSETWKLMFRVATDQNMKWCLIRAACPVLALVQTLGKELILHAGEAGTPVLSCLVIILVLLMKWTPSLLSESYYCGLMVISYVYQVSDPASGRKLPS